MDLVERLVALWTESLPESDTEALAAFRDAYTDPVRLNGVEVQLTDLVVRARMLQRALLPT